MAINTWDGAAGTDWNDAGNWNTTGETDRVPTSADDVIIPNTSSLNNPTLSATGGNPKNVKSLEIQANGTIVGGGIAIRAYGENSNGYAVDNDGIIDGGSTLHLIIKTDTTTALDLNGTSGSFTNVEIDHASCVAQLAENASILGTLTVTLGEFDTASNRDLTVTGDVSVTGTLTGNASAISMGSLTIASGGTYSATSGTTTITSESGAGYAANVDGTFTHNNGTLTITTPASTFMSPITPYNLIINHSSANVRYTGSSSTTMTIANDLTITAGIFDPDDGDENLTVTGDVSVTGTLGASNVTSAMTFGSLTIASGGTYSATSGTTTLKSETSGGSTYVNDGTFTHNNGTLLLHADIPDTQVYAGSSSLYNVTSSTGNNVWLKENITIANDLTITSGTFGSGGGNDKEVTVHGNVFISGGEFGNGSETGAYTVKGLVTLTGGTFDLSSGTINLGGIRNAGGTIS